LHLECSVDRYERFDRAEHCWQPKIVFEYVINVYGFQWINGEERRSYFDVYADELMGSRSETQKRKEGLGWGGYAL